MPRSPFALRFVRSQGCRAAFRGHRTDHDGPDNSSISHRAVEDEPPRRRCARCAREVETRDCGIPATRRLLLDRANARSISPSRAGSARKKWKNFQLFLSGASASEARHIASRARGATCAPPCTGKRVRAGSVCHMLRTISAPRLKRASRSAARRAVVGWAICAGKDNAPARVSHRDRLRQTALIPSVLSFRLIPRSAARHSAARRVSWRPLTPDERMSSRRHPRRCDDSCYPDDFGFRSGGTPPRTPLDIVE